MSNWNDFFKEESSKPYYALLKQYVLEDAKTYRIYPPHKDIFNAFKYCKLANVKVVILGMDPYHGTDQAHGLAFSVAEGVSIPPSLRNIYKELEDDLQIIAPETGCLIPWAKQGVLLLNSILTVRRGEAGSHKNSGWQTFSDNVIRLLNETDRLIVFLLWGAYARSKKELITNTKHAIYEAPHTSPLSSYTGFFGSKPFSKTNKFLTDNGIDPIDWSIKE